MPKDVVCIVCSGVLTTKQGLLYLIFRGNRAAKWNRRNPFSMKKCIMCEICSNVRSSD